MNLYNQGVGVAFFRIIRETFRDWWKNISYSLVASLFAALNPFFIVFIAGIWVFYTRGAFFVGNASMFFVILSVCFFAMPFFPTVTASYQTLEKYMDGVEVKSFFKVYWKSFKGIWIKALVHSLVNGVAGLALALSVLYYKDYLAFLFPYNYILIGISSWFMLMLFLTQITVLPLLYTDDYPFHEYYMIGFIRTVKHGFLLLFIGLVQGLIMVVLTIPVVSPILTIIPLITYFGLTSFLHIHTFRYIDDYELNKR